MTERVRLPSSLVMATLAYASGRGADVDAIAAELAIPEGSAKGEPPVVSARQARELLEAVAVALDDPMLGVHIAQSLERGAYGVVEFACRSAPDVRSALERLVRFIPLVSAPGVAELHALPDGGGVLRFRFAGVRGTLGRQGNEFFAALMWIRARELTGASFRPSRIAFEHEAPRSRAELETFFGVPIAAFSGEWNEIGFDAATLELPILSHEPHLLPLLDKMAEEAVRERGTATGLADEVARYVRTALRDRAGEPSLDEIARGMGMSGRTLQRRLNEDGEVFADVVDSVRNELACLYLRDAARSLEDIAGLLGYAGSRPFQRAFKRWTGMTPVEYRRAHAPARPS